MNYQKIITDLEHHARESAEFLASYPDPDEMESEKAAHRAMVCAVHALRELTQERAAHDAMHLASLKTAEKLAEKAVLQWCTNQSSAAATMEAIIAWSQQMQTALNPNLILMNPKLGQTPASRTDKGVGSTAGSALNLGNAEWISMVKRKPTTGNLPFLVYAPKRQPKARLALMVERCPVSPDWEYWSEVSLPNTEVSRRPSNT